MEKIEVKTTAQLKEMPEEYQAAIRKIIISHAVNELYGATVFDEPAIAFAPHPYAKWLTCRVAMEEYGHHVRFRDLGKEIGIAEEDMQPDRKRPLNIFEFPLRTWPEFCAIKMLADFAEILQVEDLAHCSFHPLRNLARMTMPEEQFHCDFGIEFCTELCKTPEGKAAVQEAIDRYFPMLPAFFGRPGSKNNEMYRRWGIKKRKNEEMLADYMARAKKMTDDLGLTLPPVAAAA